MYMFWGNIYKRSVKRIVLFARFRNSTIELLFFKQKNYND